MRLESATNRTHNVDGDYDGLYADRLSHSKSRDNLCVGRDAGQRLTKSGLSCQYRDGWQLCIGVFATAITCLCSLCAGSKNREFCFRHDWNSLISDDPSLLMKHYTEDYFPHADVYVRKCCIYGQCAYTFMYCKSSIILVGITRA